MNKNINLKIKYSIDCETKRVLEAIKHNDWYNKMGYDITLPKKFSIKNNIYISYNQIKNLIESEYSDEEYRKIKVSILKTWHNASLIIKDKLSEINFDYKQNYNIVLTKYGVGGSYNLPNNIIVNISNKNTTKIILVIIHEIVHLCIERLIQQYKINHEAKEIIVSLVQDKICHTSNLISTKMFNKKYQYITTIFNHNFPDIKKIIKLVGTK